MATMATVRSLGPSRRMSSVSRYGGARTAPVGSTGDPALDRLNFSMPAGTEFGEVNLGDGNYGLIGEGGRTRVGRPPLGRVARGGEGGGGDALRQFGGNAFYGDGGDGGDGGGGGNNFGGTFPTQGPNPTQPVGNTNPFSNTYFPNDPGRNYFANPPNVDATTPYDPGETYAYDRAKDYEANVAKGTNEETSRELARARDEISVGMRAEGEDAIGRGADPSLFRSRALESGKRDLGNLQARLADVSLRRRESALGLLSGSATARASSQRAMHLGTMQQRLAEQRYQLDAAETQSRLREAPYDRLAKLMETYGRYGGMVGRSGGMTGSGGSLLGTGFGGGRGYAPGAFRRPSLG